MNKMLRTVFMAVAALVLLVATSAPAAAADVVTHPACESWARSALAVHISGDDIVLDEWQVVEVVDFCVIFGGAVDAELAKPADQQNVYAAVSDPVLHTFAWWDGETYSMTATDMGYTPYFDMWHLEGLM